jgi:uncharacterized protein (DUF697 family)
MRLLEMNSTNGSHELPELVKINPFEGAACLRTLVGFAKEASSLTPHEMSVLQDAWDRLELPATLTPQGLVAEEIDLKLQLSLINSEEGRERTYTATYLLAHSDGPCSTKQQELLNTIRAELHISDQMATPLSRIYGEVREMAFPAFHGFIANPDDRLHQINEDILKFSLNNAVTGACPTAARSVATGVIIFSTQSAMVGGIGQYWGFSLDTASARLLIAKIQGETGLRIAIQSLQRKGSPLDNSAFLTTWALGNVVNRHYESGCKLTPVKLRELYTTALGDAQLACETSRDEIAAAVHSRMLTLELLNEELSCGNINSEEYDRKIMGLH